MSKTRLSLLLKSISNESDDSVNGDAVVDSAVDTDTEETTVDDTTANDSDTASTDSDVDDTTETVVDPAATPDDVDGDANVVVDGDAASVDDTSPDVVSDDAADVVADDADAIDDVVDENETTVVEDDDGNAEAAVNDANETEHDIEDGEMAVERFQEIATGLESICAELRVAETEGGLQPASARMLNIAVESLVSPLELGESCVPSFESFGGQTTRVKATQVSLEGVGEVLKQIYEAIKATLIKIGQAVMAFIKRVLIAAEKLKARGQALVDNSSKAEGSPAATSIDLGSLANKIAVNGAVPSSLTESMSKMYDFVSLANWFDGESAKYLTASNAAFNKLLKATDDQFETLKAEMNNIKLPVPMLFKATDFSGDNAKAFEVKDLPGNKLMQMIVFNDPYTVEFKMSDNDSKPLEEASVHVLSATDIGKIGDMAVKIATQAQSTKSANKTATMDMSKAVGSLQASDSLSQEHATAIKTLLNAHVKACSGLDRAVSMVLGHSVKTALVYVQIGEKMLAQYKGVPATNVDKATDNAAPAAA